LNTLDLLAKKHNTWVEITQTFGLDKMTAEDIVQDMYLKIDAWSKRSERNKSILYEKDDINYYFVFKTLRTLFLDYVRREQRSVLKHSEEVYEPTYIFECIDKEVNEKRIEMLIKDLAWYDRKVFDLIYKQGLSMLKLSEMTGISYYSIYRTIQKIKRLIKKQICD
jgi:RNA polymerase sigma factor (sigma-70 family)